MRFSHKPPSSNRQPPNHRRQTPLNIYYRAEPSAGNPSPFQQKQAAKSARRYFFGFLDIILILVILAGLGYSLVISPKPKVLVNNQSFHSLNDYRLYADQLFSQLKNRNKITYDEQSIASAMRRKFPEITSVGTELPIFSEQPTLRITVAPASLRVKENTTDYVVDDQGVIVGKLSQIPVAKNLPQLIDKSGFPAKVGQPLLSAGAVSFIKTVVVEVKAAKVPLASLTLPTVAQEMDLRTADQPYFVKFYLGGDALTQTGQYLAARNHFKQINQPPATYLDVRVPGKIFYK